MLQTKNSPGSQFTTGVFFVLLLLTVQFSNHVCASPFLTQDQNPLSLIHGQPQPASAALPEKQILEWSMTLDVTNTAALQTNGQEFLFMDFESYLLRLDMTYGLTEDLALKINIPYISYDEGFLDSTIDSWHQLFNLSEGIRPNIPKDKYRIFYSRNGSPSIDLASPTSGMGDIQLAIGKKIFDTGQSIYSFWVSIDLPTGDQASLASNNASDLAFSLAAQYKLQQDLAADASLGILFPGEDLTGSLKVEEEIWFGFATLQWYAIPRLDLKIQLNAHTPYYSNSGLIALGPSYSLTFGGTVHISNCSDLDLGITEDIRVESVPDVSFLFSWKTRTGRC